jgi:hypothetical protein
MLIIEIILTVFVWKKGWKWMALLPLGGALFIGFLIGLGIGASGGSVDDVSGLAVFIDVAAIVALIIMLIKGPKTDTHLETNPE